MTSIVRYANKSFPAYAHRPGETVHPNKPGGHSYGQAEPDVLPLTSENFKNHPEYLFGFDLYNFEYFWEAHVYWEACWHSVGRKGEVANLLKGLILLSAGNLKWALGQKEAAMGHWKRSLELLKNLPKLSFLGVDLPEMSAQLEGLIQGNWSEGIIRIQISLD